MSYLKEKSGTGQRTTAFGVLGSIPNPVNLSTATSAPPLPSAPARRSIRPARFSANQIPGASLLQSRPTHKPFLSYRRARLPLPHTPQRPRRLAASAKQPQHPLHLQTATAMSALGTLSGGAAGVSGLLRLRRRAAPAPAIAAPSHLPAGTVKCAAAVPDAAPIVWGRQLRPALLLPAALLPSLQPARRHTLQPPAAAAESAGSVSYYYVTCTTTTSIGFLIINYICIY